MFIIVACLFVFLAVYLLAWYFLRPRGISVKEEWTIQNAQADTKQRILHVVLCGIACALAAYGVTGEISFALLGLLCGYFVANWLAKRKQRAYKETLCNQYGQVLVNLASAMQGGLMHYQALEDVVPTLPNPSRKVFAEILSRTRTGSTLYQAVMDVSKITGWKDLESLAMAFKLYDMTGCSLVKVFNHLAEAIRERDADRRYISAVTAEIRITASILSILPFVLIGLSRVLAPGYADPLFSTLSGNLVILVCVLMVYLGNKIIGGMVQRIGA